MKVNIFKILISKNGRDSVVDAVDVNYTVNEKHIDLVRRILINSYTLEYEDMIYVYLFHKEVKD